MSLGNVPCQGCNGHDFKDYLQCVLKIDRKSLRGDGFCRVFLNYMPSAFNAVNIANKASIMIVRVLCSISGFLISSITPAIMMIILAIVIIGDMFGPPID
jgi:hypothetical protein